MALMQLKPVAGQPQVFSKLAAALPAAGVRIVNSAAFAGRAAGQQAMRTAFKSPSPGIIRANQVIQATVQTPIATVIVRNGDPAFQRRLDVAMGVEERGGTEQASDIGRKVLSVPVGIRTTKGGGIARGAIARLVQRQGVFVGKPKGRPEGIYQRLTGRRHGSLKLLVLFKPETKYRAKLGWHDAVDAAVRAAIPAAADSIMQQLSKKPGALSATGPANSGGGTTPYTRPCS